MTLNTRATLRLALAAGLALAAVAPATAAIEEGYEPGGTPVPTSWYGATDPAAMKADRDYIAGMRPHHAGALTMAQEYLADPQASSPVLRHLAGAIIRNQSFEIGLLDEVARNLDRPPLVLDLGFLRLRRSRRRRRAWRSGSVPSGRRSRPGSRRWPPRARGQRTRRAVRQGDDDPPPGGARHGARLPRRSGGAERLSSG